MVSSLTDRSRLPGLESSGEIGIESSGTGSCECIGRDATSVIVPSDCRTEGVVEMS